MINKSLTNEQFIEACHKIDYSMMEEYVPMSTAVAAKNREIDMALMPKAVQEAWAERLRKSEANKFNPMEYLAKTGRLLPMDEFIISVSVLTRMIGETGYTQQNNEVLWEFSKRDNCLVALSPYGVFISEMVPVDLTYKIIGYCTTEDIAWFSYAFVGTDEAKDRIEEHEKVIKLRDSDNTVH